MKLNIMSPKVEILPTLYKRSATGAVQQWSVAVYFDQEVATNINTSKVELLAEIGLIHTTYGQVGGQLQSTSDKIYEGKNLGKKNETSASQQAVIKARQMWEKKKKQGYVENIDLAKSGSTLPGIKPMLAYTYEDYRDEIKWPGEIQPKLDGIRCIAIVTNGVCKLYSRSQKLIETVPHINKAIEKLSGGENHIFDGELYNHKFKHDFNRIVSLVKRADVHPDHELVQYHIYDLITPASFFKERYTKLINLFLPYYFQVEEKESKPIQLVETIKFVDECKLLAFFYEFFIYKGYEGAMYRNPEGFYEHKRSKNLLKIKPFRDEEFLVTGVEEGNGKLQGKAGAIWCVTKEGKPFKAKMEGSLDSLTDYLVNSHKYVGRMLTVRFQNYTPAKVPRFPVGIRFREEE